MGLLSCAAAFVLWQFRSAFVAMIWPLLILGAFELVVGGVVALRTPAQAETLARGLDEARAMTVSAELDRMRVVNRNFRVVKIVELVLIGAGVLAVVVAKPASAWYAIGLGLLLQGSALLTFDAFAHHRGELYEQWLNSFSGARAHPGNGRETGAAG